ncbi:helix-turn-helix domain-containing protein [Actinophytocola sediminis]
MPETRRGPRARDRVIGARLRAIRKERTTLSLEEAAKRTQYSLTMMSRIENGKRHVSAADVATLCTVYGLPKKERQQLVESAEEADSIGWWDRGLPGVPSDMGTLASYEADATGLTDWSANLVPGLLQTYDYAVATMRSVQVDPRDIEFRWMARLRRQQVLGALDYTAFIGEAALRTPFGGTTTLQGQLRHLIDARNRGIGVHVLREHTPHALINHSWMLLEFPTGSPVVYVEAWNGSMFLHEEVAESYFTLRRTLEQVALSTTESQMFLRTLLEEM